MLSAVSGNLLTEFKTAGRGSILEADVKYEFELGMESLALVGQLVDVLEVNPVNQVDKRKNTRSSGKRHVHVLAAAAQSETLARWSLNFEIRAFLLAHYLRETFFVVFHGD